jgi:hypothetical protein
MISSIKNKKAVEINFAWMFAIVVGVVIILIAIYATTKLVNVERKAKDTELGSELSTLLTPVETSVESGKSTQITTPQETRIYNECDLVGTFGTQKISAASKSGMGGNDWEKPAISSKFYNKYLFSSSVVQGKNFYILSKPFSLPYKVADLIIMWSNNQKYCFIGAQQDITDDVSALNLKNINLNDTNCQINETKVCFDRSCSTSANIYVDRDALSVKKKGMPAEYYLKGDKNALLFAAIFTDPALYECQVKRLMKRTGELAMLYASKSDFLSTKGCTSTALQAELITYANLTSSMNSTLSLNSINRISDNLKDENKPLDCPLF